MVATATVAVALVIGAVAFTALLERSVRDELLAGLRARAADIGALLADGAPPADVLGGADDELVQIVDLGGAVTAAGGEVGGGPALAVEPGESAVIRLPGDDEPFLVTSVGVDADGTSRIIMGRSLETVEATTASVRALLVVTVPLLVALVAAVTWLVVGRALAPVERMRREVDAISASDLGRRVDVPPTDDEIAALAQTLNATLDRLEASQDRQRRFVSDTSHELRSPIASLRERAELAILHPESVTSTELADEVLATTDRLQALVDDLLVLARLDEDAMGPSRRAVDLDDFVLSAADRVRARGRVAVDVSGVSGGQVIGDAGLLRRLVDNVVDNAARHAAGHIAIELQQTPEGRVRLLVDDDGPGIPAAARSQVFERFARLDDARARDRGGVGLGLAIVSSVARAHNGSAWATDAPLGGARIVVDLPAAHPATGPFSADSASRP